MVYENDYLPLNGVVKPTWLTYLPLGLITTLLWLRDDLPQCVAPWFALSQKEMHHIPTVGGWNSQFLLAVWYTAIIFHGLQCFHCNLGVGRPLFWTPCNLRKPIVCRLSFGLKNVQHIKTNQTSYGCKTSALLLIYMFALLCRLRSPRLLFKLCPK